MSARAWARAKWRSVSAGSSPPSRLAAITSTACMGWSCPRVASRTQGYLSRNMAGATAMSETLRARVEAWIANDPDPEARAELGALLDGGSVEELTARFAHGLSFGTAGLRARLGAGPSRMNVATVRT